MGIIVTGSGPKKVIVSESGRVCRSRARWRIRCSELYQDGALLQSNDNWKDGQQAENEATGLAPGNDLEAAIVAELDLGSYTVVLRGRSDSVGVGLVEAYDLDPTASSMLANTSTRGLVQTGDDVLIGGFIVGHKGAETVLVRAIGPSLAAAGVSNPLADPTLDLYDANGVLL